MIFNTTPTPQINTNPVFLHTFNIGYYSEFSNNGYTTYQPSVNATVDFFTYNSITYILEIDYMSGGSDRNVSSYRIAPLASSFATYNIAKTGFYYLKRTFVANNTFTQSFNGTFTYNLDGSLPSDLIAILTSDSIWTVNLHGSFPITFDTYGYDVTNYSLTNLLKPQIKDYFTGYSLDTQPYEINLDLTVVPTKSGNIKIHFYQLNGEIQKDSDGIDHPTVDIVTWSIDCKQNQPFKLKLTCVPCSISLEGNTQLCNSIKTQISNSQPRCFPEDLPVIKAYWESLYNTKKFQLLADPKVVTSIDLDATPYLWAATPRWGQQGINDLNIGQGIGENVNDAFIYDKYFSPQLDGTFGSYIMPDSAMLKKISFAIDADTWGVNPDDPLIPRVDNLGWRTARTNEVLGIRVKTDGTIDEELEKTTNRRLHVDGSETNDLQKFNPNCFGSGGLLVRYLPNKFNSSGTVAGGYRKIKDIPQLLAELHEQANAAMGYQEGTAIEINIDGQTYRYANQLALLTELFITMKQTAAYSKGAFFSSVIGEQTVKEVMSGLGLRTVDKFLEFKVAGKTAKLYYKGISASQSIRRKMSAMATNIGSIIGNIT
jgi:hypothetical protein